MSTSSVACRGSIFFLLLYFIMLPDPSLFVQLSNNLCANVGLLSNPRTLVKIAMWKINCILVRTKKSKLKDFLVWLRPNLHSCFLSSLERNQFLTGTLCKAIVNNDSRRKPNEEVQTRLSAAPSQGYTWDLFGLKTGKQRMSVVVQCWKMLQQPLTDWRIGQLCPYLPSLYNFHFATKPNQSCSCNCIKSDDFTHSLWRRPRLQVWVKRDIFSIQTNFLYSVHPLTKTWGH